MVDNDLDLDFKLNLGLVIFARFSDIQKLKQFLDGHPELRIVFQKVDKEKLRIVKGGYNGYQKED